LVEVLGSKTLLFLFYHFILILTLPFLQLQNVLDHLKKNGHLVIPPQMTSKDVEDLMASQSLETKDALVSEVQRYFPFFGDFQCWTDSDLNVRYFNRACQADPEDDSVAFLHGCFYVQRGNFEKGLSSLSSSIVMFSPEPRRNSSLFFTLTILVAASKLLNCLESDPQSMEYTLTYGLLLLFAGHLDGVLFISRADVILSSLGLTKKWRWWNR
jgi:hypothetical protein